MFNDPVSYSNSFGLVGTYFDVITDISKNHDVRSLLNLNVDENGLINCFNGFEKDPEWKRETCIAWILWAMGTLKELGGNYSKLLSDTKGVNRYTLF